MEMTALNSSYSSIDWSNFNSSLVIEVTRPSGVYTCSGVAIANDVVLTAAHCLEGSIFKVRVFNQATYNPRAKSWDTSSFELHPEYCKDQSDYRYDVARIKLKSPLPPGTKVFPIIKDQNNLSGKILRLGFGARSEQNIRTITNPQLKSVRQNENILELEDFHSYSGDSGGPIFVQRQGQMYLVAIHSTLSYGPQGRYSYNPMLSKLRSWIHASWN